MGLQVVARHAPPATSLGSLRAQPEHRDVEPAACGRLGRLDRQLKRSTTWWTTWRWPGSPGQHGRCSRPLACPGTSLSNRAWFHTWQQSNPTFKPLLLGSLWDAAGPAARHCPARHRCDALLCLRSPGHCARPGPAPVGSTRPHVRLDGGGRGSAGTRCTSANSPQPWRHLPRVAVGVPYPIDMDVGADLILYWDCISKLLLMIMKLVCVFISSHDLHDL